MKAKSKIKIMKSPLLNQKRRICANSKSSFAQQTVETCLCMITGTSNADQLCFDSREHTKRKIDVSVSHNHLLNLFAKYFLYQGMGTVCDMPSPQSFTMPIVRQNKKILDRHVHGGHVERLEHDPRHVLRVGFDVCVGHTHSTRVHLGCCADFQWM